MIAGTFEHQNSRAVFLDFEIRNHIKNHSSYQLELAVDVTITQQPLIHTFTSLDTILTSLHPKDVNQHYLFLID
jgi:hypothetical protein